MWENKGTKLRCQPLRSMVQPRNCIRLQRPQVRYKGAHEVGGGLADGCLSTSF